MSFEFDVLDLWIVELGKAYKSYQGFNLTDKECGEIFSFLKELKELKQKITGEEK